MRPPPACLRHMPPAASSLALAAHVPGQALRGGDRVHAGCERSGGGASPAGNKACWRAAHSSTQMLHVPAAGPLGEKLVRFDKRDASGCLLALRLTEDEAAEEPAVSIPQLRRWNHCSHAWLLGRVAEPTEGYSEDEQAALLPLLATGEEQDETDEEDWEDGAEEEEEGGEGAGAE